MDGHVQYCTSYCSTGKTVVRVGLLNSDLSVHMCDTHQILMSLIVSVLKSKSYIRKAFENRLKHNRREVACHSAARTCASFA